MSSFAVCELISPKMLICISRTMPSHFALAQTITERQKVSESALFVAPPPQEHRRGSRARAVRTVRGAHADVHISTPFNLGTTRLCERQDAAHRDG